MLESILAMGGTNTQDLLSKTVDLKPQNNNDSMRFQTELQNSDDLKVDNSVLEVKRPDEQFSINGVENKSTAFDAFQGMDNAYHRVIGGMQDIPSMKDHLKAQGIGGDNSIRTNSGALGTDESMAQQTERLITENRAMQNATMDYHTDMSKWSISTQMFMAKVKVLTSMVSQASQGLKTLFRSSG